MKRTKTKLVSSIVTLLVCFAMLVGSTFAWFTDSASTGVNTIKAGNLDIEVSYKNGTSWENIEGVDSLFSSLWEPGHTEYVTLKIENKGTLALNYKVMVSPVSENGGVNVDNLPYKLSEYLKFGTTEAVSNETSAVYESREAARNAVTSGFSGLNESSLNGLTQTASMAAGETKYMTLVVYMPDSVANEANYKTGTTAPTIDLGITVLATQKTQEDDSFANDYDAGAITTPEYIAGAYYEYFEAVYETTRATAGNTFEVTKSDSNRGIIAKVSGQASSGTEVNMVITKTSVPTGNFGITVEDGHELNGYDIKVTGQDADSLVQGQLYVGTGLEDFMFYHNGRSMVKVVYGNSMSLQDGEFSYNPADGYVYFATTTFSPFQATYKAPVAAIGTAVYGTIQDAIMATPTNATESTVITVLKDVEGGSSFGYPDSTSDAKRNVVIDFVGHSYEFLTPGMGSTGTENQAMHLINGNTLTLRNGKLSVSKDSTVIKRMIQNYCDLTLENMIIDCTNVESSYNNSFCRSTVTITGNTQFIASNPNAIIFDVDGAYSDGEKVEVLFDNSYTGSVSGNIEYVSAKSGRTSVLKLENGDFSKSKLQLVNCTTNSKMSNISKSDSVDIALPDGYIWDDNTVKIVVGKIGNTLYSDLDIAMEDISEGDTLEIISNTTLPENSLKDNITITSHVDGTILKMPLTQTGSNYTGLIINKKGVKISNLSLGYTDEITSNEYYGILDIREGDVTIDNVKIGPVWWSNASSIVVKNGLDEGETLTISNSILAGGFKTINFVDGANGTAIIENCDITGTYTFNVNSSSSQNLELVVKNSRLHGWTSYGDIKSASFSDTEFSKGDSGYDFIRPYADTTFTNCTFDSEFLIGAGASGKTYNINNCYKESVLITSENVKEMLLDTTGSDGTYLLNTTIYVNGNLFTLSDLGD